jgi:hypothetical protein
MKIRIVVFYAVTLLTLVKGTDVSTECAGVGGMFLVKTVPPTRAYHNTNRHISLGGTQSLKQYNLV